jgi:hypothetical protein
MQPFFGTEKAKSTLTTHPARGDSTRYAGLLRWPAQILGLALIISGCGGSSERIDESSVSAATTINIDADTATQALALAVASTTNSIEFPIEVFGPRGASKSVTFNLDNTAGVTGIYLRCYACGYDDKTLDADATKPKARLRINAGPLIALNKYTGDGVVHGNPAVEVMAPEKYYGSIGGGFRTVRFLIPPAGLKAGVNTITFEHANPDTRSIGFRIIDLTVRRGAIDVIPKSQRKFVDASLWVPALPAAGIAAGESLWFKRNALYDANVDALDGQLNGGLITGKIKASCSDCHARDGRDLHYFRFSDHAITERSKFHRLTEVQGKQIAAYIRSLRVPAPQGAWPWNPPYQPGPGLDSKPVTSWAAGAGIDAVLEKDADMKPYLFPGGRTDSASVAAVVNRYSTLNMREMPIALQLPDWNSWLPRLHPIDAFNNTAREVLSDETGNTLYTKPFFEVMYDTARAQPSNAALDTMLRRTWDWFGRGATCFTQTINNGPDFRAVNSVILNKGLALPGAPSFAGQNCANYRHDEANLWGVEAAKAGLSAWNSVKQWEIVHSNNLEESSKLLGTKVCSAGRCINASEARGWGTTDKNVFHRAAHFVGFDSRRFRDQDQLVSTYGNTAWYHLQVVMNPGYRLSQPAHFPYVQVWIGGLEQDSNESQSFRYWASHIKMRQLQTNGTYGNENGLDLRTAQPMHLISGFDGDRGTRSGVGPELWKNLSDAHLRDFLADAAHATAADWAAAKNNSAVQPSTSRDITLCIEPCRKPFLMGEYQGQNTFRAINILRNDVHVDPFVLNRLINWGSVMWPYGDWSSLQR